jgi:hypothetical protein
MEGHMQQGSSSLQCISVSASQPCEIEEMGRASQRLIGFHTTSAASPEVRDDPNSFIPRKNCEYQRGIPPPARSGRARLPRLQAFRYVNFQGPECAGRHEARLSSKLSDGTLGLDWVRAWVRVIRLKLKTPARGFGTKGIFEMR